MVPSELARLVGFRTCQEKRNALPYRGRVRAAHLDLLVRDKGLWQLEIYRAIRHKQTSCGCNYNEGTCNSAGN